MDQISHFFIFSTPSLTELIDASSSVLAILIANKNEHLLKAYYTLPHSYSLGQKRVQLSKDNLPKYTPLISIYI